MSQFLRVSAVAHRYDTTASTIWRWSREKRFAYMNFPKPVVIGPGTTAWAVDELDAWDSERLAERQQSAEIGSEKGRRLADLRRPVEA